MPILRLVLNCLSSTTHLMCLWLGYAVIIYPCTKAESDPTSVVYITSHMEGDTLLPSPELQRHVPKEEGCQQYLLCCAHLPKRGKLIKNLLILYFGTCQIMLREANTVYQTNYKFVVKTHLNQDIVHSRHPHTLISSHK